MNIAICGYPRSGSTMFFNMLRSTVEGYSFPERELSAVFAFNEYPPPVISKFPSDCFYRDEVLTTDPNARFIATIRDPRSVLCSRHQTTGDQYKVSWDRTYFGKPSRHRLQKQKKPGKYRYHWGLVEWDRAIDQLPDPFIVRYEDLVLNTPGVQARLQGRFGFLYTGRFADFHKSEIPEKLSYQLNGVRPVEQGRVASWKDHPERIRQQFSECPELHEIVIRRGYEENTEWIRNL